MLDTKSSTQVSHARRRRYRAGVNWLYGAMTVLVMMASAATQAQTTFDNGEINTVDGVLDGGRSTVRDSAAGAPTTVNFVAGGVLPSGGMRVLESSVLGVFEGSELNGALDVLDNAMLQVSGGTLVRNSSTADLFDMSRGTVTGGVFDCSGQQCLRTFGEAVLSIVNVQVNGGSSSSVDALQDSLITVRGGTYSNNLDVEDDATLNIFGGTFPELRVSSGSGATANVFGTDFLAVDDEGEQVLDGFGVIDDTFNGVITGTLADGSTLEIDAFNVGFGSRIVLAPVPVPAAAWLFVSAIGVLAWRRRNRTM